MNVISKNNVFDAKAVKLRKKAYDAFNNAKQRCENVNNPSYASYGGLGVKVLFVHFDEFLGHIGLPPSKSASLDRIDANGNYELGNVRWVSAAIQANNKKASSLGSSLSIQQQKSILLDKEAARAHRAVITEAWGLTVTAIRLGSFAQAGIDYLSKKKLSPDMFEAGWELSQVRDIAEPLSYFHMPSLTHLGDRVRLVGGPLPMTSIQQDGIISGLSTWPKSAFEAVKKPFFTNENGALLVGGKAKGWLSLGGIEGIMMTAASHMKTKGVSVLFLPLLEAIGELDGLGPKYKWDSEYSSILDSHVLFIPDLQIEFGAAVQPSNREWSLLASLLDYRVEAGHKTYLCAQNFNGLPAYVREKFLSQFFIRQLSENPMPCASASNDFVAGGPKLESLGFSALRAALAVAQGQPS